MLTISIKVQIVSSSSYMICRNEIYHRISTEVRSMIERTFKMFFEACDINNPHVKFKSPKPQICIVFEIYFFLTPCHELPI